MYIIHYTAQDTAAMPNNEEEAGTPGDVRKGGFEVRISKEPHQDDTVELISHDPNCLCISTSQPESLVFSVAEVYSIA